MKFCQNRFISGSVDGLINVFDTSSGFDEDEGFLVCEYCHSNAFDELHGSVQMLCVQWHLSSAIMHLCSACLHCCVSCAPSLVQLMFVLCSKTRCKFCTSTIQPAACFESQTFRHLFTHLLQELAELRMFSAIVHVLCIISDITRHQTTLLSFLTLLPPPFSPSPNSSDDMQAALNIDNSVSQIGLYGSHSEKLWCLSHTETLHLWEWMAACDEESAGVLVFTRLRGPRGGGVGRRGQGGASSLVRPMTLPCDCRAVHVCSFHCCLFQGLQLCSSTQWSELP